METSPIVVNGVIYVATAFTPGLRHCAHNGEEL